MNRPLIAVAALAKKLPSEKVMLGMGIHDALTEHKGTFATPNPSQADLLAATQELQAAIEEAATNSDAGKQRLKKALKTFAGLINSYQHYVNQVAQGDGEVIENSGLSVSRAAHRAGPLVAPLNARLTGNNAEELLAQVTALPGAKAYLWMIYVGPTAPTQGSDWQVCDGSTYARLRLRDLTSGTRVWMRCAGINALGLGPWSEPVSRLVL